MVVDGVEAVVMFTAVLDSHCGLDVTLEELGLKPPVLLHVDPLLEGVVVMLLELHRRLLDHFRDLGTPSLDDVAVIVLVEPVGISALAGRRGLKVRMDATGFLEGRADTHGSRLRVMGHGFERVGLGRGRATVDMAGLADGREWWCLEMVRLAVMGIMVLVVVVGWLYIGKTTVASAVATTIATTGVTIFRAIALATEPVVGAPRGIGIGIEELVGDEVAAGKGAGLTEVAVVEDDPLAFFGRRIGKSLRQLLLRDHLPQRLDCSRVLLSHSLQRTNILAGRTESCGHALECAPG